MPIAVLVLGLLAAAATLIPPRNRSAFDIDGFGRLPVLLDGRVKPFDTAARSSLLMLQGRQRVVAADRRVLAPSEWLLEVLFRHEVADALATFEIVNPDVLAIFDLRPEDGVGGKRFSFVQLKPHLGDLDRQAQGAADAPERRRRTAFQGAVLRLCRNIETYQHLKHGIVPLAAGDSDSQSAVYKALASSWQQRRPQEFNEIVGRCAAQSEARFAPQFAKCRLEARFNHVQPFYMAIFFFVGAFFLATFSWIKWPDALGRSAFWMALIGFAFTTVGIGVRMWIESRPPVTNLYSSALFVGWTAVALCLALDAVYRNAIGSAVAGLLGFGSLIVAHHLSLGGDTMEMMRAVLDSNFWLATHVVTITAGYGANYLAGFLGVVYIARGVFTSSLDRGTADALVRMVYGIVCFATFFTFVGTVLGGIWADQAWGRFWGWDPKENGALIVVLWNAIVLHARWGGMVRGRGLMCLAVFGNIVTTWSWFGVNMLGVGLHSYGFMDAAFWWLIGFAASQLALIAVAQLPEPKWRSFRSSS